MIPYGRQYIDASDIEAVVRVLESDFLTQGPKVPLFETSIAQVCSAKYAVAVNSATSALHIACRALGVGKNDIVWTSPISFVASANCALYCGATIDFIDVDKHTGLISTELFEKKLIEAYASNKLPKVVIPVHLAGHSCDMVSIHRLCKKYDIKIIEDASHAVGASYKDTPVGSCTYSDITVFSFHPVKIITAAEGGMALTNCIELANSMQQFRSHGITRNEYEMDCESHGPWYYQQVELGFNYRMTDLQAALGLSQLNKLKQFVDARTKLVSIYNEKLADIGIDLPLLPLNCQSSWHLYIIRLKDEHNRLDTFKKLRDNGIGVNVHYIPIHTQPYYQKIGFEWGMFPNAEDFYSRIISLPIFPTLTQDNIDTVIRAVKTSLTFKA